MTETDTPKSARRLTLFLCFLIPALCMTVIYFCMQVWPLGKNSVLVLDLNAQYIYYFEEFREILRSGDSILYSFKRALGGEFMGIFAYYLSSPFSVIVALLPKSAILESMFLILVLKCGFTGLTFGWLIDRKFKFDRPLTVMFAVLYALTTYAIVMQHNVMWMDNLIAFPLILAGLDDLITRGKFKLYVLALFYAVFSNFYIGYMACFFVLVWFFIRYPMLDPDERNPMGEQQHFCKTLIRVALWSLIAVLMAAVVVLPVYYSLSFGKLEFSTPNWKPKQLFPFLDIVTKAFFGSYDTVRPTGMPHLYAGTLALVLSPLYFFSSDIPRRRKIGYAVMMLFLIVSFNFSPLDIIWHGMQRPNWLNARFAYMFCALELLMAAEVVRHLGKIGEKAVLLSAGFWCALLLVMDKIGYDNLPDFRAVWPGILCFVLIALFVPPLVRNLRDPKVSRNAALVLCVVVTAEAFANGVVSLYALDEDVSFSNRNSYRQMLRTYEPAVATYEEEPAFFRSEKLVHRKKNDNFALGIRGLSNSTSTLNAHTVNLLGQFGYASQSHWSMYVGATAVTDALFDIRYVMADETDDKPVMNYIHDLYTLRDSTTTHIDVYENPYALSLAYAVDEAVLDYDAPSEDGEEKEYVDPFTYMNKLLSAMTGEEVTIWRRVDIDSTDSLGVDVIFATGHRGYEKNSTTSGSIKYTLNIESTDSVYCYFPSRWPRDCTLQLNGKKIGTYFDNENLSIRELGPFEPGEEVEVSLIMKKDDLYIRSGVSYFWYFDEDAFVDAISLLQNGTAHLMSERDDHLIGTVAIPENREVLFTTIPYDAGWKITIDGEPAELIPTLNESLISLRVTPGEHEIEMVYDPACVKLGLFLTTFSAFIFTLACTTGWFEIHLPKKKARKEHD